MDNQSNKNSLDLQNNTLNSLSQQSTDINYEFFKQMMNVKTYRRQIQKKIQELNQKRTKIYEKVISYEKTTEEQFRDYIRGEAPQRKKRNRRNADEIQRQYNCPTCFKKYGSEGSMFQHIKLKHPNLYEPKKKGLKSEYSESFNEKDSQLAKQ